MVAISQLRYNCFNEVKTFSIVYTVGRRRCVGDPTTAWIRFRRILLDVCVMEQTTVDCESVDTVVLPRTDPSRFQCDPHNRRACLTIFNVPECARPMLNRSLTLDRRILYTVFNSGLSSCILIYWWNNERPTNGSGTQSMLVGERANCQVQYSSTLNK